MRLRVDVVTSASEMPWDSVLAPGRGIAYDALSRAEPALGQQLHEHGVGVHGLAPFGHGAPVFPDASRVRGRYGVGGCGTVEFGSPLSEVVEGIERGLKERELLDWGGVALRMTGLAVSDPPDCSSGKARWRTSTPVVMKGSGRDADGVRTKRQAWVLPSEEGWVGYVQGNLRRKAESLGLDPGVRLEQVTWIGPKRAFRVGQGSKPGAPVELELSGPPETLQALWSWGIGQANSAGFGWVSAD